MGRRRAARPGRHERRPYFFWCERDGEVCLTALGIRRRLPVPGRVFWQFDHGPTTVTPEDLDEWLAWLLPRMRHEAARLMMQPAMQLDETGDQMETVLDAHGLTRRRTEGALGLARGGHRAAGG